MSTTSGRGAVTLQVDTIALIAGISVVGTILLIILVVAVCLGCRKMIKRKKRDRSRNYIVQDGVPPYSSSSVGGGRSSGQPSYSAGGHENQGADIGEFRPNPLAENPFYHHANAPSLINLPQNMSEYGDDQQRHSSYRLAQSTQSLSHEYDSFYASLYEKLVDTIHTHQGRPLYLCKRENYHSLSDHFDIIGKTRTNDWLIRPRGNTPNRPVKKGSKKQKAPKASNSGERQNSYRVDPPRGNGYVSRPGANNARITTPFGPGERMPTRYLSGFNLNANDDYERYTSLPRDGRLHSNHEPRSNNKLRRQASAGAADVTDRKPQQKLNEHQFAQVMKKNALNGGTGSQNRRPITTIEESPHVATKPSGKSTTTPDGAPRERAGSISTVKSLGITDQFKFLEQYDTEEERF